jgi:tetratricopeptide (TPR) repeat protein
MSLTAYAYFLEHEGRLDEALEILILATRAQGTETPPQDFAVYALFAGRLNRQLARWDAANSCYSAAEEAALLVGDTLSGLRGRLGRGAVHRGQGNFPLAQATAEEVLREASERQLVPAQAMAYADLGPIYYQQGLRLEALKALYNAFRLSTDTLQQMRTLGDLAIGLTEIGAFEAARIAFRIVVESNASVLVRANAHLELMDLESAAGNRVAFERCRSTAEEYRNRMSPSMLVDYYYKLGTGLRRFSQLGRARDAFTAGLKLSEEHRLNAWYFKIERVLSELAEQPPHVPVPLAASELSGTQAVREMEMGLREYALTADGSRS